MAYSFPDPAYIIAYKAKHHITNKDLAETSGEQLSFVERWMRTDTRYRPCPEDAWKKIHDKYGD